MVRIRLLLRDKGFYSGEVIQKLKALGVKFLVAVPRNSWVMEPNGLYPIRGGSGEALP